MSSKLTTEQSTVVAALLAKMEERLVGLAEQGVLPETGTLTHFDLRIEQANGDSEWVTDDGQVFVTKTSQPGFDRCLAPFIPSAAKKIAKGDYSFKDLENFDKQMLAARRGIYALRETRLASKRAPRTLPGIQGKIYSKDARVAEIQKLGDANEKIGL